MKNDGERLAVLEAGMNDMKKGLEDVRSDIKALTKSVDALVASRMAEQVELRSQIAALNLEIVTLTKEMTEIKNANSPAKTWIKHTLSGVLGAGLTFLVIEYLKNSGR